MPKIQNNHQLAVTRSALIEFKKALKYLEDNLGDREPTDLEKLQIQTARSMCEDLQEEIDEYLEYQESLVSKI